MDTATKAEAHRKLAKFTTKIGYPASRARPDNLVGNLRRASEFVHAREAAKLGKPIDRTE
ncbi:MAG: hypothetical protein M2R45_05051 [Verrucomicrobia subdivision 3 bacterium]|nr:hypothetical protein [Limisphaerales bacterium]MCS1412546.1 hypothetical protein [Limisphaerales bacterium]